MGSSQYETASKKKIELDEAMSRCLEHSCPYLNSVPDKADYKERWLEARNKYSDLQKRKTVYGDNFQAYVQSCTDSDASVSQIEDKPSKVSSASSIKINRELIALRKARRALEVEAKLQQEAMEAKPKLQLRLADLDAEEENLMPDEEQSRISGRQSESHRSNVSLKIYAEQLPSASRMQPELSQPAFISFNFTNVKDVGRMVYSKPFNQPNPSLNIPNFSSSPVLQPTTNPLNYTTTAFPVIPIPCVTTNSAPRVTFPEERWINYASSRPVYANPASIPIQHSSMGPETTCGQAPSNANTMTAESLKCLGSIIQQ